MAYKLSSLDAIHIAAVLDDCVDQLGILGRILPTQHDPKHQENDEINELIEEQKRLEGLYKEVMSSDQLTGKEQDHQASLIAKEIHANTQAINKSFRRNKAGPDNGAKIQADRKFLHDVLSTTLKEIETHQTFETLVNAVNSEKEKKTELLDIVRREEESRKRVKQLQRALIDVRKEREVELQKRSEMIAHLKDQLQETKAKTAMESKYIKKDAEVRVSCAQKKCLKTEQELKDEIKELEHKLDDESRTNAEIESFLRTHHTLLEEKVEYWMEKYDVDIEAKQQELDSLKNAKAQDLSRLQELTQKYHEYEKVVQEDKVEKERMRRQEEKELEQLNACIKIQSWWRGVMVRKQLGPYSKKKKGKKGKKSAKGKKKKKK